MKGWKRQDQIMLVIIIFFIILASGCAQVRVNSPPPGVRPTLEALQHHQNHRRSISIQFTRSLP
jgi:hypothetical protein